MPYTLQTSLPFEAQAVLGVSKVCCEQSTFWAEPWRSAPGANEHVSTVQAPALRGTADVMTCMPFISNVSSTQAGVADGQPTYSAMPSVSADHIGEAARKALGKATTALKRYGWVSFWVQLTLSVVSGVVLLFSVAFTAQVGIGHKHEYDCKPVTTALNSKTVSCTAVTGLDCARPA